MTGNVYVTGISVISSLGRGVTLNFDMINKGASGIVAHTYEGDKKPSIVGLVNGYDPKDKLFDLSQKAIEDVISSATLKEDDLVASSMVFAHGPPDAGLISEEVARPKAKQWPE